MSIIHEALKKAASIKKAGEAAGPESKNQVVVSDNEVTPISIDHQTAAEQPTLKTQSPKSKNIFIPILGVALILILSAIAVYSLNNYFAFKKPLQKVPEIKTPVVNNAPVNQTPRQETQPPLTVSKPVQKDISSDAFVLSGIVSSEDEYMAIINGSIYTKGDFVQGAKITDINSQRVLLKKQDKEIELKLK